MSQKFVVGLDGSPESQKALDWSVSKSGSADQIKGVYGFSPGAELIMSAVQIDFVAVRDEIEAKLNEQWLTNANEADVEVEAIVRDEAPAQALIDVADEAEADAIVVGNHGTTRWSDHHLGGTPSRLLHSSTRPTVIVNDKFALNPEAKRVVVAVSADPEAPIHDRSIEWALQFAEATDSYVHLVHVAGRPSKFWPIKDGDEATQVAMCTDALENLAKKHAANVPSVSVTSEVLQGSVLARLTDASEGAALLVLGALGSDLLSGMISGATTRHLPAMAHAPVAVVPSA